MTDDQLQLLVTLGDTDGDEALDLEELKNGFKNSEKEKLKREEAEKKAEAAKEQE